jgi:microcystin-dependent protein
MNANVGTNPSTLLGFGVWTQISKGRMLVGQDAADVDFDAAGKTGGSKTVALTGAEMPIHSHGVNDPGHSHGVSNAGTSGSFGLKDGAASSSGYLNTAAGSSNISIQNSGSGQAHQNMSPYLVAYIWRRDS